MVVKRKIYNTNDYFHSETCGWLRLVNKTGHFSDRISLENSARLVSRSLNLKRFHIRPISIEAKFPNPAVERYRASD